MVLGGHKSTDAGLAMDSNDKVMIGKIDFSNILFEHFSTTDSLACPLLQFNRGRKIKSIWNLRMQNKH